MKSKQAQIDPSFWRNKRVFVTGHTGFKGSWLVSWLDLLGAEVAGYALAPETDPALFEVLGLEERLAAHTLGDVRDLEALTKAVTDFSPEIVLHLAAQPLVRLSYEQPVETYATNVMGTVHLLEAVRRAKSVRSVVVITTDKVYENNEWVWGYREHEPLGGYDPYSSSKAACELVVGAYRRSFFNPAQYGDHGVAIASARAGNVLGGGDWSLDRIIPDAVRAFVAGQPVHLRNPASTRPWQHVLEPLEGYLLLAERCYAGPELAQAFNFGPEPRDVVPVGELIEAFCQAWGEGAAYEAAPVDENAPHEAGLLQLDFSKAKTLLGWRPRLSLQECMELTAEWYRAHAQGADAEALRRVTAGQIGRFSRA